MKVKEKLKKAVRRRYAEVARSDAAGCGCSPACCGPKAPTVEELSRRIGYTEEQTAAVPEGSNMGLGCGNPQAIAKLKEGETVLDLGCGGGFDCFLAAEKVGAKGRVIGVDMTPEMISKARENSYKGGFANVEFRLGEIEHLPVPDSSVDVIISNCVINLSPEKPQVFREAHRVLRPGGRLAVSDIVATREVPPEIRDDIDRYTGCVSGAALIEDLLAMLAQAGFEDIRIGPREESRKIIGEWLPGSAMEKYVVSASIEATKPGDNT